MLPKTVLLKVKKEVNESFFIELLLFVNIYKYSKIQYQGEIVYFYKPNLQKYVSSKILLPF